jgi:hypothetical protein
MPSAALSGLVLLPLHSKSKNHAIEMLDAEANGEGLSLHKMGSELFISK